MSAGEESRADARNLRAIVNALRHHREYCPAPVVEIRMSPFEVDRLGWDEVAGIPIVGDARMPTGRFDVVCERDKEQMESALKARAEVGASPA